MYWDSAQHPGHVTKNEAATFHDVIHDWMETSLVCNIDITDMILPSDAEYLMLTFHMKALKDPGIFSMHGPLSLLRTAGWREQVPCKSGYRWAVINTGLAVSSTKMPDEARPIRLLTADSQ